MEARLKIVEDEVVAIRGDVQQVKETVVLLEDRQARLHGDIRCLTHALGKATDEVSKLNTWVNKRGAFLAGASFVIVSAVTVIGAVAGFFSDWFRG